jgi:hypothetical protein
MKLSTALLLAAFALPAATPAAAIDRIGWSNTRATMYIHGDIEVGDAAVIANSIRSNRRTLRGVILNSGGGNVFEAVKLVDLIRDLAFDTGVTRGGTCASACFMLWAAGKNRYLYADSTIGIHSASGLGQNGQREESGPSMAVTLSMARIYLALNVPMHLIGAMVVTPPDAMYWLTPTDKASMLAKLM